MDNDKELKRLRDRVAALQLDISGVERDSEDGRTYLRALMLAQKELGEYVKQVWSDRWTSTQ